MSRETTVCPGSSNIVQFTYDDVSEDLEVRFQDGRTYLYRNVPRGVAQSFQRATSRGEYFYRQIRNRYASAEDQLPPEDDGD